MRLSLKAIVSLQKLFAKEYGLALSDEDAQTAGLKIIRYVYAMEIRRKMDTTKIKE